VEAPSVDVLRFASPAAGTRPTIHTLGHFDVVRDGRSVPAGAWQSKKARDVLKLLVARRGRPSTRDALMEALWPDQSPDKTTNRLSVALSTVRSVLDPEHRFEPNRFFTAAGDTVVLQLRELDVDVEEFLSDAAAGLSLARDGDDDGAIELLQAAEVRYAGDFLEENPYDDWAVPLREEARAAYVAVAVALADLAHRSGDYEAALRYRLRVLERDAYDERSHLALVIDLRELGRHGEARRAYGHYVARMEELGVEPAPFPAMDRTP
jgi:DNA-binding SARP family transcriptional activator